MTDHLPTVGDNDWKPKTYLIGGLAGLAIGLLSAYFFARVSEEGDFEAPPRINTIDALKLAVAILAIMRQITDLGTSKKK